MKFSQISALILGFGAIIVLASGCDSASTAKKDDGQKGGTAANKTDKGHDHGHDRDHGHDHGHSHGEAFLGHGPHGGDMFKISTGGIGELCYNNANNIIALHFLNDEKQPRTIKADSIEIVYSGGKEPETYKLEAVEKSAEGQASQFSLDSQDLAISVFLGCRVNVKDGDQDLSFDLPKMERHNH